MKCPAFFSLAVFPLVWVLLFVGALSFADDPATRAVLFRSEIEAAKVLGLAGCVAAGLAFEPGEYMRRAWFLHGLSYATLLVRDALFVPPAANAWVLAFRRPGVEALLVLLANAAGVVSTWRLARAFRVAGLEHPRPDSERALVSVGVASIAVIVSGPAVAVDVTRITEGNLGFLVTLGSDVGDVVSVSLIAPVFFTALAARGGLLSWPFAMFGASLASWLLYDATVTFGPFTSLSPLALRTLKEVFRGLACTFVFAAGFAQRAVLFADRKTTAPRVLSPRA